MCKMCFPVIGEGHASWYKTALKGSTRIFLRSILSYAVGRKTLELSPIVMRVATIHVHEKAFGASMTGVKLLDSSTLSSSRSTRPWRHSQRSEGRSEISLKAHYDFWKWKTFSVRKILSRTAPIGSKAGKINGAIQLQKANVWPFAWAQ